MKHFTLFSLFVFLGLTSIAQDKNDSNLGNAKIKSPFEALYGEKLSFSLHKINNEKQDRLDSDYFLFKANGNFEQSLMGIVNKGSWNYNQTNKTIFVSADTERTFTIKEIQKTKLLIQNTDEIIRLYIKEKNENLLVLAKPTTYKKVPKADVDLLEGFYNKSLMFFEETSNEDEIKHRKKDFVIFYADGKLDQVSIGNSATGTWVYFPKTKMITIDIESPEIFEIIKVDEATLKLSNSDRSIVLKTRE